MNATEALTGNYAIEDRGHDSPCWIWQRYRTRGYGQAYIEGKVTYAHRAAYELHVGPIPKRHDLHHRCHVPLCINPDHVEPISHRDHHGRAGHGKMTAADARELRWRYANGWRHQALSDEYGISTSSVHRIIRGERWSNAYAA